MGEADAHRSAEPKQVPRAEMNHARRIQLGEAWPWLLLIGISVFCIVAQAIGFFHEGLGMYLYIGACVAAGAFGVLGLIGWASNKISEKEKALRYSNLAAATEELYTEMEKKRPDYRNHWKMVSRLSRIIGERMGLSLGELESITRAAQLMDIGMLDFMDEIGRKPADDRVMEIIKKHPLYSEEILAAIDPDWSVLPLVRHHHEHFDGSGYPDSLEGEEIPLGARILTVADAFAAMVSKRPYASPKTVKEAIAEIEKCGGSEFDPGVAKVAADIMEPEGEGTQNLRKVMEGCPLPSG